MFDDVETAYAEHEEDAREVRGRIAADLEASRQRTLASLSRLEFERAESMKTEHRGLNHAYIPDHLCNRCFAVPTERPGCEELRDESQDRAIESV